MKAIIKGFTFVSYTDKKTGELKEGWEVHVQYPFPKNIDSTGVQCNHIWVNSILMTNTVGMLEIDREYIFDYDGSSKYPTLVDILPVDPDV